jgi:hypothetical protein
MVDGAPRPGTVRTLSHWPGTPTPGDLWDDTSTGIVLRALARPDALPRGVELATVDHYDADGVIALGLLCVEGLADQHGPVLAEAARAGDFDVVTGRRAALVAFGLGSLLDVERAAARLGVPAPPGDGMERTAWAAEQALQILPALVDDPERHRALWEDEARAYDASVRALAEGWASIEEHPAVDLAVVRVEVSDPGAAAATWGEAPLHPAAVHSNTACLRVATMAAGRVEVRYRYESWVRLVSRRPRPRVDLTPVAVELSGAETAGARWVFDGAGAITGALHVAGGGVSTLDPEWVVEVVGRHLGVLDAGPPAWDPYSVPTRTG